MKRLIILLLILISSCNSPTKIVIDKNDLVDKLEGFWLGQSIANWTGLVTEMNKIGFSSEGKQESFYTRENWGELNEKSWGQSEIIDFKFAKKDSIWGSDDDTDLEYMYQELLLEHNTLILTGDQIRNGWLKHIKKNEQNYLWVSNQKAFDLMNSGILPPETSSPSLNPHYEMIDAQLTTEIFGLYSPLNLDYALELSSLPIRTVARENAEWISQFYIIMHSLAYTVKNNSLINQSIFNHFTSLALDYGTPIINGVLTTNSRDQAWARAGGNDSVERKSHKGEDCAHALMEMIQLKSKLAK